MIMKKSLLLLATAFLVLSCGDDSVRNNVADNESPIGFVPSFMEKSTRANAGEMIVDRTNSINTFDMDENDFEVWGWKTNSQGTTKVFDNQQVKYDEDDQTQASTNWIYTPLKYWDKTASYIFYAAAPFGAFDLNEDNSTDANRKFTASNVPTVQVLQNKNAKTNELIDLAYTENGNGTNSTAIDYLIAAKVSVASGAANQSNNAPRHDANDKDVEFTFSHILSKLTVRVLTTSDFAPAAKPDIKLTELTISLNGMSQSYAQKTAGEATPGQNNADTWSDAISTAVTETCFFANDNTLSSVGIDSLLLTATPQSVASYFVSPTATGATPGTATVKVLAKYTVFYADGIVENCATEETTVTSLTSFIQNNSYTLDVKISPEAILFDVNTVQGFTPVTAIEQEAH